METKYTYIDKNCNNIKEYTKTDIERFLTGNNLIDGVNSSLQEFVSYFYNSESCKSKNINKKNIKMFLGRISDDLSLKIDFLLNSSKRFNKKYCTKDTNIVINSNNIEHIYKKHAKEKRKGQLTVTPKRLAKYRDVISNPDYIGLSSQLSRGNTPILYFTKKINGYSVAVEVLSTRKQLYPQTYYIFKSNSPEYKKFIINNKLKKACDMESNDIKSFDINVQNDIPVAFSINNSNINN